MPLPFLLAAAAAPSIMKGITGLFQLNQDVKKRDTTPEAFKESLALTRQSANTDQLPGQGAAENRIAQGTAAVNAGAVRAGGSSSDVLASLAASDAQQQQALSGLTTQATAYHQQQQGQLRQGLSQEAAYQQRDQENYDREKAALKEGGLRNIFGALDGVSQVAAYGLNKDTGTDGKSSFVPAPPPGPLKLNPNAINDAYPATPGRRYRGYGFGLPAPAVLSFGG